MLRLRTFLRHPVAYVRMFRDVYRATRNSQDPRP